MKVKIFSEKTHFTAVHNLVFDVVMPLVTPAAFKVLMFFVRQTRGHNRRNFSASYQDISDGAGKGLKSKESVYNSVHELLALDEDGQATRDSILIRQPGKGPKDPMRYALNPRYTVTISFRQYQAVQEEELDSSGTECEPQEALDATSGGTDFEPTNGTDSELPDLASIKTACDPYRRNSEEPIAPSEQCPPENSQSQNNPSSPSARTSAKPEASPTKPYFDAVCKACQIVPTRMSRGMRWRVQNVARAFLRDSVPVEDIAVAVGFWPMQMAPGPEQLLDHFEALMSQSRSFQSSQNANPTRTNANQHSRDSHHDTPFIHQSRRPILSAAERKSEKWDNWLGELCGGSEDYSAAGSGW